jgi:hypothetical protein
MVRQLALGPWRAEDSEIVAKEGRRCVIWGDSTPDDVWQLARRFLDYKRLFSYHTHHLQTERLCSLRRIPMLSSDD